MILTEKKENLAKKNKNGYFRKDGWKCKIYSKLEYLVSFLNLFTKKSSILMLKTKMSKMYWIIKIWNKLRALLFEVLTLFYLFLIKIISWAFIPSITLINTDFPEKCRFYPPFSLFGYYKV